MHLQKTYKAFISYSHAADAKISAALRDGLTRFTKPWFRLRALRVYWDKTNLAVAPGLWSAIEAGLKNSEYYILLASREAATSEGVQRELGYWLKNCPVNNILIVLTSGQIVWDNEAGDFDWARTTALSPLLEKAFEGEPGFLDLRWARKSDTLSLDNPEFLKATAGLSSTLQDRDMDELFGEEVRQHRRAWRLAWSAIIALIVLTLSSLAAAFLAVQQRNIAERRLRISIAQALTERDSF